MQIHINGESRSLEKPVSVIALLDAIGMGGQPVVVELNGKALHQREHATEQVTEGARIELIRIVAGG